MARKPCSICGEAYEGNYLVHRWSQHREQALQQVGCAGSKGRQAQAERKRMTKAEKKAAKKAQVKAEHEARIADIQAAAQDAVVNPAAIAVKEKLAPKDRDNGHKPQHEISIGDQGKFSPHPFTMDLVIVWQAHEAAVREWNWPADWPVGDFIDTVVYKYFREHGIVLGGYSVETKRQPVESKEAVALKGLLKQILPGVLKDTLEELVKEGEHGGA